MLKFHDLTHSFVFADCLKSNAINWPNVVNEQKLKKNELQFKTINSVQIANSSLFCQLNDRFLKKKS